ncbi:MAG TPA: TIGR01906 family membrane protein [Gaiella sp.]|nr:TIGR01906 family membrane protein [Gaiella sp.]
MRVATWTVAVLVAVSVPMILVVNGFRVLATDTFVEWELGRDGFPPDLYGFDTEQRTTLAKLGLRSIEPGSEGIVLLERATLADGSSAFGERELTHMRDVRTLFGAALRVQLVAVLAIVALGLLLWRTRLRAAVPAGLLAGSLATLAIAVLAVPVILLGFDGFFVRFHEIFFSGDSWEFSNADTLIRIYPEQFWIDVSRLTAAIAVTQAIVLAALSWWWLRVARRRAA